jgi:hypothetical protein
VKAFLLFLFAGPLIGWFPIGVFMFFVGLHDSPGPGVALVALYFGYLIGLLPAAMAGGTFVAFCSTPFSERLLKQPFMLGAISGVLGSLLPLALWFVMLDGLHASAGFTISALIVAIPSGIAGGCCAVLSRRLSPAPLSLSSLRAAMSSRIFVAGLVTLLLLAVVAGKWKPARVYMEAPAANASAGVWPATEQHPGATKP